MKFVSFNINGLRARPHQLEAIVEQHQPDVIGLQETKVHDDMFPLEEVAKLGYNVFYHGGLTTAQKALMTTVACVSICCWPARLWQSAALKPVSTTISAAWKNRPITRRSGQNSSCNHV